MIKIVCIYQDVKDCPFTPNYVIKLYNSIKRNTTKEFEFHCYTNDSSICYIGGKNFLISDLMVDYLWGWWNKLPLFNLEGERIIYFDLDTIILDNIDSLLNINSDFAIQRCPGLRKTNCFNGTLISWRPEVCHHLWDNFHPVQMSKYKSDQEYLQEHLQIKATWIEDPRIVSYKYHIMYAGQDPEKMKIVYCSGYLHTNIKIITG